MIGNMDLDIPNKFGKINLIRFQLINSNICSDY